MNDDLSVEEIEEAEKACCTRCKEQIASSRSVIGTLMFNYYLPALGARTRGIMCGACGLAFREFVCPDIASDPVYRVVAAELRSRW